MPASRREGGKSWRRWWNQGGERPWCLSLERWEVDRRGVEGLFDEVRRVASSRQIRQEAIGEILFLSTSRSSALRGEKGAGMASTREASAQDRNQDQLDAWPSKRHTPPFRPCSFSRHRQAPSDPVSLRLLFTLPLARSHGGLVRVALVVYPWRRGRQLGADLVLPSLLFGLCSLQEEEDAREP